MPFRETEVEIVFAKGYNIQKDLVTLAKEVGSVTRAGAFYTFGTNKWQGFDAMAQAIVDDQKLFKELEKATHELLQKGVVKKAE